jgi:hypothetical protein
VTMLPKVYPLTPPATPDRNGPALPEEITSRQMMPSGVFITNDPRPQCMPQMYNPCFFTSPGDGPGIQEPLQKESELRARYGEIIEVSQSALVSYGDMILKVRAEFGLQQVDAVVVPLCGALRPASLVFPMGNFDLTMLPIPFTRGSSGAYDNQIVSILGEHLTPLYGRDPLRLGILDTGIGGQSLIHLVSLLRRLHDDAAPYSEWNIYCNIIVSANNRGYLDKTNAVKRDSHDRFVITRQVYPTQSLIAEDKRAAIGHVVDWGDPAAGFVEPVSHRGALVVRGTESLQIFPTHDIARSLDQKVAEATTTVLQSGANIFLGNIWEPGAGGRE